MASKVVVLVNPGHDDEVDTKIAVSYGARMRKIPRNDPPISIINLGGYIRDKGFDVVILDTHVTPDYLETLRRLIAEKPLAIGFSTILGKFTRNAVTLSKFVKSLDPEIPVIWGGKLAHLGKEILLGFPFIDFLVIGDGEIPLHQLLQSLESGKAFRDIPGIAFRQDSEAVINPIPAPIHDLDSIYQSKDFGWDLVKQHINHRQVPYFINLYTSRGCKFNCSFCYLKDIHEQHASIRFRRRSAENIIREIDFLNSRFGINVVTFGDDDFLSGLSTIQPVLQFLRDRNIFIEHLWTNIANLTSEAIAMLSGLCQTVCYSIETASPRLQEILHKKISTEKILDMNAQLRRAGITTVHNILFAVPTETDTETKANIDLLRELKKVNPHVRANSYILSPIPNTPIFDFAEKLSGKKIEWGLDDLSNFHFRYMGKSASKFRPYLSPEENQFYETVSELSNELYTEMNSSPTPEQARKIDSNPRLKFIFGDIHNIPKPTDSTRKYILDQVLESEERGKPLPRILPF